MFQSNNLRVKLTIILFLFLCSITPTPTPVHAGFLDSALETMKKAVGEGQETLQRAGGQNGPGITQSEIMEAFKEALALGAKRAVDSASRPGGFLNNPNIRIPLPGMLQQAATILQAIGMGSQVSAFEETMNRAAEKAAFMALPIFADAIKGMTFNDAKRLLEGDDRAITTYFREKTWNKLYESFLPVVHDAMQQVGVTQRYQALISQPAIGQVVAKTDFDLDHYVSTKALEGLFVLLGDEETRIRENPAARSTELLQNVFGTQD